MIRPILAAALVLTGLVALGVIESASAVVQSPAFHAAYFGNGIDTRFPFSFPIIADADLVVTVNQVTKANPADYTVEGDSTVVFAIAPALNTAVTIRRNTALGQPEGLRSAPSYTPSQFERAYDRIEMQVQEARSSCLPPPAAGLRLPGQGCAVSGDCASGTCSGDACAAPPPLCTQVLGSPCASDLDCCNPSFPFCTVNGCSDGLVF